MAVKATEPLAEPKGVEGELQELLALFGRVVPALKRGGAQPPSVLLEAAGKLGPPGADGQPHGTLGPRHGPLLMLVALERDLSVSELAARVGLSLSTTSLMVGELSRAGLVERTEDDRDRRRTLVRLHADHAEEVAAWMRDRIAPLRRALERLEPEVRAHFLEGWRVLDEEVHAGGFAEADPGAAEHGPQSC
jgi:DNA-binding MarR family transcriptional regulator